MASMIVPPLESEERVPHDEEAAFRVGFDASLAEVRDELLAYLRRRLGDRETAADLTQEALLRMLKYREAPEIEDRRAMLFRIANNLVLEYRRARYRHHAAQHVTLDDAGPLRMDQASVEAIADARQTLDRLLTHTITGLPPKCRLAFMLNRFDGLTYPQVAARMHISVKMVEKHITRALAACRLAVGDRDF
jgi:RNA polymerase sigma factor (sigma-70 family)